MNDFAVATPAMAAPGEDWPECAVGPIRFLPGGNRGRYPFCNSVYVEGAGVLIDPGAKRERIRELRDGPGVREIWLTHWHEDHFAHLDLFDGVPIAMMREDAPPLGDLETLFDWYGFPEPSRPFFRRQLLEEFRFRPRTPDRYFRAGEVIDLGVCTAEVIASPGHTPGHIAFFFREPGVLYLGDYDLTRFGPWYGDRDSSIDQLIDSVERLRAVPARAWMTSHEQGFFEGDAGALFADYLGVIDERQAKLEAFLSQPRSMAEIAAQRIIYRKPRDPKEYYDFAEVALMAKHLERMIAGGRAVLEGGKYRLL